MLSNNDWTERKTWAMGLLAAVLAGLTVVAILEALSHVVRCKPVMDIHDVVQIRTLLGYEDENTQPLTREKRFQGGLAVILTPIIDNTSCSETIVSNGFSLQLLHESNIDEFEAAFITNIHPDQPSTTWHAIQDDLVAFSVKAGESWTEDLLFTPSTSRTYMEFIKTAKNQNDLMLRLEAMLNDTEPISATCRISGKELWKEVVSTLSSHGRVPGYVQNNCARSEEWPG